MIRYGSVQDAFDKVWTRIHHVYSLGLFFALVVLTLTCLVQARRKESVPGAAPPLRVAIFAALAVLLRCLSDFVGSGSEWPIYPFWPLTQTAWGLRLDHWGHYVLLAVMFVLIRIYAKRRGRSVLDSVSLALDRRYTAYLRRSGKKTHQAH